MKIEIKDEDKWEFKKLLIVLRGLVRTEQDSFKHESMKKSFDKQIGILEGVMKQLE